MDEDKVMVIFQPSGRRGEVPKGITLIEASRLLGVDIEALCGEKRVCGKCVVRIEEGYFEKYGIQSSMSHVSPWVEEEEKFITPEKREKGFRLGCTARIEGDILVFVPEESRAGKQVVSKAARRIHIEHNPAVKLYFVKVNEPTLEELLKILPGARVETVETYSDSQRSLTARHKQREVDRRVRIHHDAGLSKLDLYGKIMRDLLADQVAAIREPSHLRRITEQNGLRSLEYAVKADRLASKGR